MSQSKWRRLPKFSAAYKAEAKARAGKGFRDAATKYHEVSDEPPRPKNLRRRNPPGPKNVQQRRDKDRPMMGAIVPRIPNGGLRGIMRQRLS